MNQSLHAVLVTALSKHLRQLPLLQARALAHALTAAVSARAAQQPCTEPEPALSCFPKDTWNELTVGVPWKAYSRAHGAHKEQAQELGVQALCSMPAQFDSLLSRQSFSSGLWGGSLLVALGKLLHGARHELIVFSPYWTVDGVISLLSAAGRSNYCGVNVHVFTQPKAFMKPDDRLGLSTFVNVMQTAGAVVSVAAPERFEGWTPFVHAKLIIADAEKVYVGSANFTRSGLDHGIEAGVLITGEAARSFHRWAKAMEPAFSKEDGK
jgi:phosphatidylserine/phosphatidylglycerophosphate/cardiolipin synthase-like enzyme